MGVTGKVTGVTCLIANYKLIEGAKSDLFTYLNRGHYLIYDDMSNFFELHIIEKITFFGSVCMRITHILISKHIRAMQLQVINMQFWG
jgi:hypothetical protein